MKIVDPVSDPAHVDSNRSLYPYTPSDPPANCTNFPSRMPGKSADAHPQIPGNVAVGSDVRARKPHTPATSCGGRHCQHKSGGGGGSSSSSSGLRSGRNSVWRRRQLRRSGSGGGATTDSSSSNAKGTAAPSSCGVRALLFAPRARGGSRWAAGAEEEVAGWTASRRAPCPVVRSEHLRAYVVQACLRLVRSGVRFAEQPSLRSKL
jgi:hypothetical protein